MAIFHSWQGCVLLLILKQFIKEFYGVTEARIQNYSPQDASKVNDKPLNRRATVESFNPGPALAILQKGDPNYPLDDEAKVCTQFASLVCNDSFHQASHARTVGVTTPTPQARTMTAYYVLVF
jgi:hypothetical protein